MAKKPGYDIQPTFNLDKPLTDPSWVTIKSKKTDDAELYIGNRKRTKRHKPKKTSKVINLDDLESDEVFDATEQSAPDVNLLIKHFEERLEIMKRAYDKQSDTSGNNKILGCAISPNSQPQLILQSSESRSLDEITTKKKVRFSDHVEKTELAPQNYFKTRIFYATAKRS